MSNTGQGRSFHQPSASPVPALATAPSPSLHTAPAPSSSPAPAPPSSPPDPSAGPALVTDAVVLAAAGETEAQREARLTTLFHAFDTCRTGFVERKEIESGLQRLSVPSSHKYALELLTACDENRDGKCSFQEFKHHMHSTEAQLYSLFRSIDANFDGSLTLPELMTSLQAAGIPTDQEHVEALMRRMDADGNGSISFKEWRDLLLLFPYKATLGDVYHYWENVCQLDTGEQVPIPEGITSQSSEAWRYLAAGAVAGAASRTATAPFDRIKVMLQCQNAFGVPAALPATKPQSAPPEGKGSQVRGLASALSPTTAKPANSGLSPPAGVSQPPAREPSSHAKPLKGVGAAHCPGMQLASAVPREHVLSTAPSPSAGSMRGGSMRWAAAAIYRDGGWMGFFRGNGLNVVKIAPESAIKFYIYEHLKPAVALALGNKTEGDGGAEVKFLSGGMAGALAQAVVYPLDVLKTRIQTHSLSVSSISSTASNSKAATTAPARAAPSSKHPASAAAAPAALPVPRLTPSLPSATTRQCTVAHVTDVQRTGPPTLTAHHASILGRGSASGRGILTPPPAPLHGCVSVRVFGTPTASMASFGIPSNSFATPPASFPPCASGCSSLASLPPKLTPYLFPPSHRPTSSHLMPPSSSLSMWDKESALSRLILRPLATSSSSSSSAAPLPTPIPRRPRPPPSLPLAAPSPLSLSLSILRNEGPLAFYRGLGPSLLGIFPYSGIDLALYETLKAGATSFFLARERRLRQGAQAGVEDGEDVEVELSPLVQLLCGTVSGALGASAVFPLQVIRTRLQAVPSKCNEHGPRMTPWSVTAQIWKAEGVKGFYSGLMPNILKVAPQAAITYVVYEYMKGLLHIK